MIEVFIINIVLCLAAIGAGEIIYRSLKGD